ncbi:MAG: Hsp70 family protein, partial [Deltaproteobacteria bacterium]|nr:Hsp70 family protein [Deltaproteobacteria bacterium]
MDRLVLGIDLGTTNSVAAVADGGQVQVISHGDDQHLIPSVVSFHPDGTVLVGEEARERRLIDAAHTIYSVKRLIGRPFLSEEVRNAQQRFAFELVQSASGGVVVKVRQDTYTLTEISALVLREIRRVAEDRLGRPITDAVVTVPANFNELQRSATKAAGQVAGLSIARILNEPTAAALAYGMGDRRGSRVAVYDLGGGTFDLSILELEDDVFEVVATGGDSFLGGDDLDVVLAERMAEECLKLHRWDPRSDSQAFERLRAAAEWSKCELSSEHHAQLVMEELTFGDGGKSLDLPFQIERAEFEQLIRPLLDRSFRVCDKALEEAELSVGEIDEVILVGGSTRVPLVRRMVEEYFGARPRIDIDPDLVVAQGAAIHGYALSGKLGAPRTKGALGGINLRKLSAKDRGDARNRREERARELPAQPAFAPRPPPPP